jgi:hypothetical protein
MKELKEFLGYFVTENGRIFSAWKIRYPKNLIGCESYLDYDNLKELKKTLNSHGYYVVRIKNKDNNFKLKTIHKLIAETYIKNPNNLPVVNHIDENKTNNHVSNLEWITHHGNIVHSSCRWIWTIENMVTGEIAETINLREFSSNNNLAPSHLSKTLTGEFKQHKNFRVLSKVAFK